MLKMLVISYTRFSTVKQAGGDSLRRQTQLAADYCAEHDLTLDTSLRFHDAGKSGYSGENVRTGSLATLLSMLQSGNIPPGSLLLIENLDRLTRTDLTVAVPLLLSLLAAGLDIVTLQDRKKWTLSGMQEMSEFVMSVMLLARGHDESQSKAKRLKEVFKANRDKLSNRIFGSAPGWLKREDKLSGWEVVPEYGEVVTQVFRLAAAGWGSIHIARHANANHWPVPTRLAKQESGWHAQMAGNLLRSRQVLGEHTFRLRGYAEQEKHWKGESTGIIVPNFYPRIISDDLWHRAQAAKNVRRLAPARRDGQYFNIWSGKLFCGACGASIHRRTEFRSNSKSVSGIFKCSDASTGRTVCKSCSIKAVDATLLGEICALAASYMPEPGGNDDSAALAVAKSQLTEIDTAAERVATAIADTGAALPALLEKAKALANSRTALVTKISAMESRLVAVSGDLLNTAYADSILSILYKGGSEAAAVRADFNSRLRLAVKAIWLFPYDCAVVEYAGATRLHVIPLAPRHRVADGAVLPLGPKLTECLSSGPPSLPEPRFGSKFVQ